MSSELLWSERQIPIDIFHLTRFNWKALIHLYGMGAYYLQATTWDSMYILVAMEITINQIGLFLYPWWLESTHHSRIGSFEHTE